TLNLSTGSSVSVAVLTLSGGTLAGSDALTVSGPAVWTGGTMAGSGATAARGGLQLGAADNNPHALVLDGRTLANAGAAAWLGNFGYLDQQHGSAFVNQPGATLDIRNGLPWFNDQANSTFANQGTLTKSAGGATTLYAALNNTGTLDVETGTLNLAGPFSNFSGTTLTGGTYLLGGTLRFPGADIHTNAASIVLNQP